jgi:oligopeptide/dipeptide ABC transporter ATP-binding protein
MWSISSRLWRKEGPAVGGHRDREPRDRVMNDDVEAAVEGLSVVAPGPAGEIPILCDVSLSVRKGERFAIVGESGSGKSTVCLALLGMIPSGLRRVAGQVRVRKHDMLDAGEHDLRAVRGRLVGVVFQDPMSSLDPVRKVGWQILEARQIHGLGSAKDRKAWAENTLTRLGFVAPGRLAHSYPHELSGGMRQRACIGVAVSAEPSLILADEPTTALDMSVRGQVLRHLLSYCSAEQATLIIVSHDIHVVQAVSTRMAVMLGGRVLEEGPTSEVLDSPGSPYTRGLLSSSVTLDPDLRGQPLPTLGEESKQSYSRPGQGCPFATRCPSVIDACTESFPQPRAWRSETSGEERRIWCWNPEQ